MTYGRWTENLAAVHGWVERQDWADPSRIGTLGISSGTTAALRHALGQPRSAFVISIATCLGLYISMPRSPARTFVENTEALLAGERRIVFDIAFPEVFFRDFVEGAPIFTVASIECPVFFLQGTKDNPFRRSDAWLGNELRRYAGKPVTYREIEGGDHGMDQKAEEGASAVVSWLTNIGVMRR
jgi:dipeptidyl aminopeptidase/acylaminoacyl peptidase